MSGTMAFVLASLGLVGSVLAVSWPFLDSGAWTWLGVSGAAAFAVQLGLNRGLARWRTDPNKFVAGILLGAALRVLIISGVIVWVWVREHPHPVALLLGLAGFLAGMLIIEAGLENTSWLRNRANAEVADAPVRSGTL